MDMTPIDIAAEVLHKSRELLSPAEKIEGGLTNDSWLVRSDDAAVVIRLSNREKDTLQIDRASEAIVLNAVAQAGIGPPVLICAPDRHLLVTRYLDGRKWTARDARVGDNVARIAARLRELHALPIPDGVHRIDLHAIVTNYWNSLMARGLSARAGTARVRARALKLIAHLQTDAMACLCHNDVHHLNVIDTGKLWLVDWEYSGIGDPYFDLASVCCYHAYSNTLRKQLLREYLGHDRSEAIERLDRMCWVFNYIRELWFAVREMK
jgi:thiamine kinase